MPKLKPLAWSSEDNLYNFILTESHARRLPQKRIAGRLGISQQAYSRKLRERRLSVSEAVDILEMLDAELQIMQHDDQPTRKERKTTGDR